MDAPSALAFAAAILLAFAVGIAVTLQLFTWGLKQIGVRFRGVKEELCMMCGGPLPSLNGVIVLPDNCVPYCSFKCMHKREVLRYDSDDNDND